MPSRSLLPLAWTAAAWALLLVATVLFFWPIVQRVDSYSPGGDAMFNAWTVARDQHCILRQACPDYVNANIFFPHPQTMLYSETQLSAGLLTLPLYWINPNPLFSYNLWTIASFLFSGWFAYLLLSHLSRGNVIWSLLGALAFEFAPFKMAAVFHLQNLSIFYLPLALLLVLLYLRTGGRRYLVGLFVALVLQFYASWYQMVFAIVGSAVLLAVLLALRRTDWQRYLTLGAVYVVAALTTLPLAIQYLQFSHAHHAAFPAQEQLLYESSLADYVTPYSGTLLGKLYYVVNPHSIQNAFNLDSFSYHGVVLYVTAAIVLVIAFLARKRDAEGQMYWQLAAALAAVGIVGFFWSLGPYLKVHGNSVYPGIGKIRMPYLVVDKLLPQLEFIRAVGRASVLTLLALCGLLALAPALPAFGRRGRAWRYALTAVVAALVVFELLPATMVQMEPQSYHYNLAIPAVYRYVAAHPDIDRLVVLRADPDYPHARIPVAAAEDVLWSGYYNRVLFNGYSGYVPPEYPAQLAGFDQFGPGAVASMRALGLRYVIVDKLLSSRRPELALEVQQALGPPLFDDSRYALFRLD